MKTKEKLWDVKSVFLFFFCIFRCDRYSAGYARYAHREASKPSCKVVRSELKLRWLDIFRKIIQ
jgi:hypothetical protein